MAQEEFESEQMEESSPSDLNPTEITALGAERSEEFVDVQTEFSNSLREKSQRWLNRVQSEANLTSEFLSKLTAARLEMMAEDGRDLLADTQKLMERNARGMFNGWLSGRPRISS